MACVDQRVPNLVDEVPVRAGEGDVTPESAGHAPATSPVYASGTYCLMGLRSSSIKKSIVEKYRMFEGTAMSVGIMPRQRVLAPSSRAILWKASNVEVNGCFSSLPPALAEWPFFAALVIGSCACVPGTGTYIERIDD